MGRYAIFNQPMTPAERQARSREMQRTSFIGRYPDGFAQDITRRLGRLDGVKVVAADKALALIARDIAKRGASNGNCGG